VVSTSITYLDIDELLERLRVRLAEADPGCHVRIDLIGWHE
jgi:hypothetical protein